MKQHRSTNWTLFVATLLIFVSQSPAYAQGQGFLIPVSFKVPPSNETPKGPSGDQSMQQVNTTRYGVACYQRRTGKQLPCGIDYNFVGVGGRNTIPECVYADGKIVLGSCNGGGHTHQPGQPPPILARPIVARNYSITTDGGRGDIKFEGDTVVAEPGDDEATVTEKLKRAVGKSDTPNPPFRTNLVRHDVPQAGGYYAWTVTISPPPKYFFTGDAVAFDGTIRIDGQTFVRVPNLVDNPKLPPFLDRNQGDNLNHDGFVAPYNTPARFRDILGLIALEYYNLSGRTLDLNDAALPYGGVFDSADVKDKNTGDIIDPKNDWRKSHETHREGNEVDLNRGKGCGAPDAFCNCTIDRELFLAVNKFLTPWHKRRDEFNPPEFATSALYCESVGRKHLNLTELAFFDFPITIF